MIALRLTFAVALLAAACTPTPVTAPATPTETQAGASPAASATPTPTPSGTAAPPPTASMAVDVADVSSFVRALVPSWRPSGPTAIIDRRPGVGRGQVITAVPASGGTAVDLVALLGDGGDWDILPDGGAVVASIDGRCVDGTCGHRTPRLAVIDLTSGRARWLTPPNDAEAQGRPRWSPNGAFVYYGARDATTEQVTDLGIFRARADGTAKTRITAPVPPAEGPFVRKSSSSAPEWVTPDGVLLWIAAAGKSSVLKARDLASGSDRAFATNQQCVSVASWRPAAPNVLVLYGPCQEPSPRLALWDVRSGEQTVLVDSPSIAHNADWDVAGSRIAAVIFDTPPSESRLVVLSGNDRTVIAGTDRAGSVRWLGAEIAYTTILGAPSGDCVFGDGELRSVAATGGPPKTLYHACSVGKLVVVGR